LPLNKWGPHDQETKIKSKEKLIPTLSTDLVERHSVQKSNTVIPYWWMNSFLNKSEIFDGFEETTHPFRNEDDLNSNEIENVGETQFSFESLGNNSQSFDEVESEFPSEFNFETVSATNNESLNITTAQNTSEIFNNNELTFTKNNNITTDLDMSGVLDNETFTNNANTEKPYTTKYYEEIQLTESNLEKVSLPNTVTNLNIDPSEKETTTKLYEEIQLTESSLTTSTKTQNVKTDDYPVEQVTDVVVDDAGYEESFKRKGSIEMSNDGRPISTQEVPIQMLHEQLIEMLEQLARKYSSSNNVTLLGTK
jgi:copper chaperone CopZ